jgi:DNA-binding LytR/AlgR family response regulator
VAKFASRYEANFVCKRFVRADAAERAIWVPSEDGLMRLDCSLIDKVSAEGDYVLVHSSGRSWMVHTTMQEMEAKLGREDFIRVHRSTIVRHEFIERLCHKGRTWSARLNDGSVERISNSHVADVLAKLRASSSVAQRSLSKPVRPAEVSGELRQMVGERAA